MKTSRPAARAASAALASATALALALPTSVLAAVPPGAAPIAPGCQQVPAQVGLVDIAGVHADAIRCIAYAGITKGTGDNKFSPGEAVTRGQLASLMARFIDLANTQEVPGVPLADLPEFDGTGAFADVEPSSPHFEAINRLQQAGVVAGFADGSFRPGLPVSRAQMASFVNRTQAFLGEKFTATEDYFPDDNGSVHEANINAIASVGITAGTTSGLYRPDAPVTRAQMASFLARHLAVNVGAGVLLPLPGPTPAENLFGLANLHADTTAGITTANVASLQQAWKIPTSEPVTSAPLVADGRVYFSDWSGKAYAADAQTGAIIWERQVQKPMTQWPWYGLAATGELANGVYYVGSVKGEVYALDAADGSVLWTTSAANDPQGGVLGAVQYYDGLLFVGLQSVEEVLSKKPGFEPDFTGEVLALDATTGAVVWRLPLVPAASGSAGVPVWGGVAVDPVTGTLFVTTGNNYRSPATGLSDSVIAIDAKTGAIRWSHQVYSQDVWTLENPLGPDWDFGSGAQLFEAEVDGQMRALVGAANKSGTYFVLDRLTGETVWTTVIGYGAVGGGMRWEASIANGEIYASSNNRFPDANPTDFPINVKKLAAGTGEWTGESGWSKPATQPAVGTGAGFLSSDVYLMGSLDGTIQAYDAADGSILSTFTAPGSVASSLAVAGDTLYVGVGAPSAFGGTGERGLVAYRPAG